MSNPKTTLFLGDLPSFCTKQDIFSLYSSFGEIIEIKIMQSEENFRNLSYGFIKFVDSACAERAMYATDGSLFGGRNLKVGWASYKNKKEPKAQHKDKINSSSVHISYISYQLTNLITDESLRTLFSIYGTVLDCSIKKSYIDESINRQCGYGFVHFSSDKMGIESALTAVAGLNDATLDNVCYKCSISHNLEKQLLEIHRQSASVSSNLNYGNGNTQMLELPIGKSPRSRAFSSGPVASNSPVHPGNLRIQSASQKPTTTFPTSRSIPPAGSSLDDTRISLDSNSSFPWRHSQFPLLDSQQFASATVNSLSSSPSASSLLTPRSTNSTANTLLFKQTPLSAGSASFPSTTVSSSPISSNFDSFDYLEQPIFTDLSGGTSAIFSRSKGGFEAHSASTSIKPFHSLFSLQAFPSELSQHGNSILLDSVLPLHADQHFSHSSSRASPLETEVSHSTVSSSLGWWEQLQPPSQQQHGARYNQSNQTHHQGSLFSPVIAPANVSTSCLQHSSLNGWDHSSLQSIGETNSNTICHAGEFTDFDYRSFSVPLHNVNMNTSNQLHNNQLPLF